MKKYLILFLFLFSFHNSYSQDFSKNSFLSGFGFGNSYNSGSKIETSGLDFSIGYQRNIWKNRLRFVPSINFGFYSNRGITDVHYAYYNSTNLKLNLNFDCLKIKSIAVFLGSGVNFNYSSGLLGPAFYANRTSSEYFKEFNFAFNALLGFRLNPTTRRFAYELLLLDGSFLNKNKFYEYIIPKIRIVMKIK